ncbi:hypothetical protein ATN00_13735 [Sphingobium baderi]|uniref:Uncharacterized protein n=1 Tax=Sphingobium baderi TaxID=1332080 RepID=A0A0S3F0I1_9SPHN|nr:hypothetical protein ATN00_13735 [Sphingobium baderi]
MLHLLLLSRRMETPDTEIMERYDWVAHASRSIERLWPMHLHNVKPNKIMQERIKKGRQIADIHRRCRGGLYDHFTIVVVIIR